MKFGIINTENKTATLQDFDTSDDVWLACKSVGLLPGAVDFGSIDRHTHVIVFEHSLFIPVKQQTYFAIKRHLYAGNAVIFACNDAGETVSLDRLPPILWFKDAAAAELAIRRGDVERPIISMNEIVRWQWNVTEEESPHA